MIWGVPLNRTRTTTSDSGPNPLPPITVLVVEDESIIAMDLKRKLERLGSRAVLTAENGHDAIALAERMRPDVVIMDISLRSDMDGVTAATIIHQRFAIPIVFASAYRDSTDASRASAARPVRWLQKPFSIPDLQAGIEAALAVKGS